MYAVCQDSNQVALTLKRHLDNVKINEEIFEDLVDVLNRLKIPSFLWELIDFRTFFKLAHILSPKIKAATIGFLQQTGG